MLTPNWCKLWKFMIHATCLHIKFWDLHDLSTCIYCLRIFLSGLFWHFCLDAQSVSGLDAKPLLKIGTCEDAFCWQSKKKKKTKEKESDCLFEYVRFSFFFLRKAEQLLTEILCLKKQYDDCICGEKVLK